VSVVVGIGANGVLRGQPGRRFVVGVVVGGGAVAASTRRRHKVRLREPWGRPRVLGSAMLKTVVGESGLHDGGCLGGRMVSWMTFSYERGRSWCNPPPLLRLGSKARVYMASLMPLAILLVSVFRNDMSLGRKWWPVSLACWPMADAYESLLGSLALL
jgi:hypothetical protein